MIIGVTGMLGAGKGTIADYLVEERGFKHYSMTGFINEEITRRGLEINRDNMVSVANDLRAKFGSGYIAEQLYNQAKEDGGDSVIESIRTIGEIEILKKKGEFILFAIDADIETRYSRIVERAGPKDGVSFDEFVSNEQREFTSNDPNKINLKACREMADYSFKNDWSVEELYKKVKKVLDGIEKKGSKYIRPSWDEYFINISRVVAERATCDRGRSGCVIARDKQILVTGYVGSPKGLPHCDEVGHQFEDTIHEDGVTRKHCIRTTHAEQNAICQAAKLGISISGATLYCKMEPCPVCAKLIINSGIIRVVCEKRYQSGAQSLLEQAGVKVDVLNEEVEQY